MKLIQSLIRSSYSRRQFQIHTNRPFSAMPLTDYGQNQNDDFEQQDARLTDIYKKMGNKNRLNLTRGNGSSLLDELNEPTFDSSRNDVMGFKLKEAAKSAKFFDFDPEEVESDDYSFRPDVNFQAGMTYDTKDLDLQKPGVRKPNKRREFETTTQEVLCRADFRNVHFLAQFLTEAGIIIKRSKTGISAKAQRKVAREIKTARAFGLMPFTTMGTKHFVVGQSMEADDRDFEYEPSSGHTFVDDENE